MAILMVSYDLVTPGRDYADLYAALRTYRTRARPVESVWLIQTTKTTEQVADHLAQHIDANDKLIVLIVDTSDWTTYGLGKRILLWLHSRL